MWAPARVAVIARGAEIAVEIVDAADVLVVEAVGADVVAAVVPVVGAADVTADTVAEAAEDTNTPRICTDSHG